VIMVLAGVIVLVAIGVAVVVSILRADRDGRAADDRLAAEHRAAWYEREQRERDERVVAAVSPRPVSTTDNDPTRELIRHRCPRCSGPAAMGGDGLLRCLQRCRVASMRAHRWSP
jgi:hypothetical protein